MTRCTYCGLPMQTQGRTPFCSERCMMFDFYGVPILREKEMTRTVIRNTRRRTVPDGWTPPRAYPDLDIDAIRDAVATTYILDADR